MANAFLHLETRKADKSGCISFQNKKYEAGLPFIGRTVDVVYDPTDTTVLTTDSKLTPRHFYKGMLEQLGCEAKFYRGDAKRQLHREMELMRGIHNLNLVVIMDESHLLDREMLEELRFLLNVRMERSTSDRPS